jgi:NAD(P)-dependent dehydrogenase (short-subunit alcohol dehydrogenase family)
MKLKGKVVVITGASSGLGKALAESFLESGSRVIASSNNRTEIRNVARELGVFSFLADVTKQKDVAKLAAFALKKFGRIDVWINNAGITTSNSALDKMDAKEAHQIMDVNFFGTVYGTLSALKVMRKQKRGMIVNVISVRALGSDVRPGIYSASKWAVRGFTEGLMKFVPKLNGVSIVAVYPSAMKTKLHGDNHPAGYHKFMEPKLVAKKIVRNLGKNKPKIELIIRG